VSNLESHLVWVSDNPSDKTAALALADHIMEDHGCSRVAALRWVARARRTQRDTADIAEAAQCCNADGLVWPSFCEAIRRAARIDPEAGFQIWIVAGRAPPKASAAREATVDGFWQLHTVVIGARWIVRTYFALLDEYISELIV
jgi:hypothetical protein